jgi:hypothetical protein
MAGTATWQIIGTSDDGTKVVIDVTATLNDDGSITVDYALADDSADADIIGVYFDFFNDGGDIDKLAGGNNMKGYGDGFDVGFAEGTAGLKDGANTKGTITFSADDLVKFGFVDDEGNALEGVALMEAFAETEIGIRATSTGDDGEGSLKIGAVGEYHPEDDDEPDDWFPDFKDFSGTDISNVVVYFNIAGEGEDCVVYTVKIDDWDKVFGEDEGNDLDDSWEAILAYIIANDDNITADTPVLGAAIKGGEGIGRVTYFFGVGEFDTSGDTDADDLPCALDDFITSNDLDGEYDATDVFAA